MLAVPGTTSLRKVTVRTSEPDALAVRTRFAQALAPVDFRPASLSRSAILCVRALRDCSRRLSFRNNSGLRCFEPLEADGLSRRLIPLPAVRLALRAVRSLRLRRPSSLPTKPSSSPVWLGLVSRSLRGALVVEGSVCK